MTTQQVADRYMELQKQGKWMQIHDELYSENVFCTEPVHAAMGITEGLDAVKAKTKVWHDSIESMHGSYCSEPVIAGNYFSVAKEMDLSLKDKPRAKLEEIIVFGVKNGKIISAHFFF